MTEHLLPRSSPIAEGVSSTGIDAFVAALESDAAIEPHSVMILRHGRIIAEGWWSPFDPQRVHHVYSLSKTFMVCALGFALADGLLSLEDTVVSHFPEFADEITGARSRSMRIRDLAAMASGHIEEMWATAFEADPHEPVRGFLLQEPDKEPGSVFAYSQPNSYTLAAIIQRVTGRTLTEYLKPRLLDPLGIDEALWQEHPSGRQLGFIGLHVTTESIAKLGLLLLQEGVWQGEQVLPAGWAAQIRELRVDTPHQDSVDWQQGYGFQVWRSRHGYRGDGAFGQFCVVLPDQDMVLVTTAATYRMQTILDAAWQHLLPAVDAPAVPQADAALHARLLSLALPAVDGRTEPDSADGWPGSYFLVGAPAAGLRTASLLRDRTTWTLELGADREQVVRIPLGARGWNVLAPQPGVPPIAVSSAWTGTDVLRVVLCFLETPHRLSLTISSESRRAVAVWGTEPLSDPARAGIFGLQAPRSGS